MSHEITTRDGVFTVRNPAWWDVTAAHDLSDYPTRAQAQEIAHNWEPVSEPLYRRVVEPVGVDEQGNVVEEERFVKAETVVLNARSDDGFELGGVSPTYVPVNNSVMYDVVETIEGLDPGSVLFETGGSLAGGRKVWLMIRLRQPIEIKGDPNGSVIPFFAIQNAHDGSGAFRGQAVGDRIVCANTARMADYFAKENGTELTFSHTKNVADRIEEAKKALAGWREQVRKFEELGNHLVTEPVTAEQVHDFAERFIPMPLTGTTTDRVRQNVLDSRGKWYDFLGSATCVGIERSKWGLVQASVEYLNYGRGAHTAETRFARSMLNKQDMVTKAVALVGALR
jgi:phage/plasmid-like protein (TIGR03299 family)